MTPPSRAAGRLAAGLLIAQFMLIWTTFFILSSAIDWPGSLDDPASIALPRVLENRSAVLLGYALYLMAAILLVPATAAINARLRLDGAFAATTMGLAILSAVAKTIGIGRWLFAMPGLAEAYAAPGADRDAIALIFGALDDYAGGIGEVVGVGLVSGAWTVLIAAGVFAAGGPRGLAGFAALTGVSLFVTIPGWFGLDLGPVLTFSNIAWQFALLGIGVWALSTPRAA